MHGSSIRLVATSDTKTVTLRVPPPHPPGAWRVVRQPSCCLACVHKRLPWLLAGVLADVSLVVFGVPWKIVLGVPLLMVLDGIRWSFIVTLAVGLARQG